MTGYEKIVLATHNKGKVREIQELLEPYNVQIVSVGELGLSEPEENGDSFAANAAIKAEAAAAESGLPALADDSGLSVTALDGAPGIYSARWAGPEKDFMVAMEKVNKALVDSGLADRSAAFVCALAFAVPGQETQIFEGRIDGQLTWPPRGDKGFGYDPVFIADGHDKTFAEIAPADKQAISHRARAFAKFVKEVFGKGLL